MGGGERRAQAEGPEGRSKFPGFICEFRVDCLTWDSSASVEPGWGDFLATAQVNPVSLPVLGFCLLPSVPDTFSRSAFWLPLRLSVFLHSLVYPWFKVGV